jgi:hypothetical protein
MTQRCPPLRSRSRGGTRTSGAAVACVDRGRCTARRFAAARCAQLTLFKNVPFAASDIPREDDAFAPTAVRAPPSSRLWHTPARTHEQHGASVQRRAAARRAHCASCGCMCCVARTGTLCAARARACATRRARAARAARWCTHCSTRRGAHLALRICRYQRSAGRAWRLQRRWQWQCWRCWQHRRPWPWRAWRRWRRLQLEPQQRLAAAGRHLHRRCAAWCYCTFVVGQRN